MIDFRCFRNDDPPRLADAWRCADLGPAAVQPMTSALLESCVFSKPYFDRAGLLVALDGPRVVGFAHAGFGPNAARTSLDTSVGTTMMVVVVPHERQEDISAGLLTRCEGYLRSRGARTILGGGAPMLGGFYRGLYGGADVPGILDSSAVMRAVFEHAGYVVADRIAVLRRALARFRPPVNRLQVAVQRATRLSVVEEPPRRSWWEAAVTTGLALRRYVLANLAGETLGTATFWDMQPLASCLGVTAAGLLDVDIEGQRRRQGLASYLVSRAMHDLAQEGVAVVETHVAASNAAASSLFEKLGYEAATYGTIYARPEVRAVG